MYVWRLYPKIVRYRRFLQKNRFLFIFYIQIDVSRIRSQNCQLKSDKLPVPRIRKGIQIKKKFFVCVLDLIYGRWGFQYEDESPLKKKKKEKTLLAGQ